MSCVCDREYDSVTGEMNDYVCGWCQDGEDRCPWGGEGQENAEVKAEAKGCYCQYACDREDPRWGDYRYQIWTCDICAEEDRRQEKDEENRCFSEYIGTPVFQKKGEKAGCYCQYAGDQDCWGDARYQIWDCGVCAEEQKEEAVCSCEYSYEQGEDSVGDYRYLERECGMCLAEREASSPDPWVTEKTTIRNHFSAFSFCSTPAQRVQVLRPLFEYILTIEPFLKAFPYFRTVCVAKVKEFRADPRVEPIADLLEAAERFLTSI
jgi:hypothetical protein